MQNSSSKVLFGAHRFAAAAVRLSASVGEHVEMPRRQPIAGAHGSKTAAGRDGEGKSAKKALCCGRGRGETLPSGRRRKDRSAFERRPRRSCSFAYAMLMQLVQ
ncbi:hypothetical protein THARTR1_04594 [Trichoderma harzianum]|uniref:Uncharacterized protein n=1 Tax=Trichoderma harzianum TaxID=5544 RepID=A0A2K0UAV0_TRIHA|nr:hypothetical protein THARTR1_04594 [Trichoderma harzianum]